MEASILQFPEREQPGSDVSGEPGRKARHAIGEVLREERLTQQRTLREVAEEAAVSLPYLSEVERGRKEISSDLLEAVSTALTLDVADVLERAAIRLRSPLSGGGTYCLAA